MKVLTSSQEILKLDANDWKILSVIVDNMRQPLTKIAKKCSLSRQSVEYRIKQMMNNNLITGSRTVVNGRKLGYKSYHIFLELHDHEDDLIKKAKNADYVNTIIFYSGKYNLEISILAKSEEEFLEYYQDLLKGFHLREDSILILTKIIVNKELLSQFFKKTVTKQLAPIKLKKQYEPDKIDLKLLYSLSQDATKSIISLADEVKLSKDAVKYRIKQLEESGIIIEYRPVINYTALGLHLDTILIKLNYKAEESTKFEAYLKSENYILWTAKTFGYYDYIIYILTEDNKELHNVINKIKTQFSDIIRTYEILYANEQFKYSFMSKSMVAQNSKDEYPRRQSLHSK